ncbi:GH1 family beta-glucosidase [Idiomarina sp.]|uniref:GH1 family beta-glucosidase n=1 Tax=Idiomarina sp. TaxID=1874361 RepID=UPI0025BB7765|nr:GH1 family beta-glucosidase [Idiomarina sp.]
MIKLQLDKHSPLYSPDFVFGVATSSFQIEGDRHGRADCIWDTFCAQEGKIHDGSNGDRACEHVKHWQHDVDIIASLGVDSYRLSVAWARVINADGSVNQVGLHFYERLVDALTERGISTHITLYHWDLPQYLEDQGGWLNRDTAYRFAEYAAVVVGALGDKVASYSTINEPFCSAYLSYEAGIHAPGPNPVSHDSGNRRKNGRQAAHHLLLAHGLALPRMRELAPQAEHGIVLNFSPCHGASDAAADQAAAATAHDYHNRWYLQPLLQGSYPDLLERLAADERPHIEPGDLTLMCQPLDFLGVNYYTRTTFKATADGWFKDVPPRGDELTTMGWEVYPQGLTEILTKLKKSYPNLPPIYITENGVAYDDIVENNHIHDNNRIDYFQQHLNAVEDCITQGVEIKGYYIWSLMDNFEWAEGYTQRFGIVHIDFDSGERQLKDSAKAWQQLLRSRQQVIAPASSC